jgi:hypothetical protein
MFSTCPALMATCVSRAKNDKEPIVSNNYYPKGAPQLPTAWTTRRVIDIETNCARAFSARRSYRCTSHTMS